MTPISAVRMGAQVEATEQAQQLLGVRKQYECTAVITSQVEVAPGCFLHVEESGNPQGIPAVFFHGGPGIKYMSTDHQWFDPKRYRIIALQQRGTWGCSPSAFDLDTPSQIFKDVTIKTLGDDIEALRKQLQIDKWLVFGGSWGSTLSVYYAQEHADHCLGVVLRGIFLATHEENKLFFDPQRHAKQLGSLWKPEALERLVGYARSQGLDVSLEDSPTIYAAYRELAVHRDDRIAQRIWKSFEYYVDDGNLVDFERLMRDDLETNGEERSIGIWETLLMDDVSRAGYTLWDKDRLLKLKDLPVKIVQGAQDNLCHPDIAQRLADGLRSCGCDVDYALVEGGGHSPYSPPMTDALIRATDTFASAGRFHK